MPTSKPQPPQQQAKLAASVTAHILLSNFLLLLHAAVEQELTSFFNHKSGHLIPQQPHIIARIVESIASMLSKTGLAI